MDRTRPTDAPWDTLLAFLRAQRPVPVGDPDVCRRFLDAAPWVLQWRLLPTPCGAWNSVFERFSRWNKRGVWADLHRVIAHALTDALGNPLAFVLTGAQAADIGQAQHLVGLFPTAGALLADKGDDANDLVALLDSLGMEAVIPPRSNRLAPRPYDGT